MRRLTLVAAAFFTSGLLAVTARAQETLSPDFQCLRALQTHERALQIPTGLLTAISLVEAGRPTGGDGQLMAWPWTINVAGRGQFFETKDEAVAAVRKLVDTGERSIDIGCMQVNLRYHPNAFQTIEQAFDPAANVAYAARFLVQLHGTQGSWQRAVERYHSSDDGRREQYRERVIEAWNTEARNLVIDAVLSENTDTPYHYAIRDFVGGRYDDALDKYQAIVDGNANDRIGLLGVAMSYEELGRDVEAMQAYARYLVAEPSNQSVLAKMIQSVGVKEPTAARVDLEGFLKAGVAQPDIYAALSEVAAKLGDSEAAFTYAADAARAAPHVPAYLLNAGVLADRANKSAVAVQYYEEFLRQFNARPVLVDASVENVRDRAKFLRARL